MNKTQKIVLLVFVLLLIALLLDKKEGMYLDEFRNSEYTEDAPVDTIQLGINPW